MEILPDCFFPVVEVVFVVVKKNQVIHVTEVVVTFQSFLYVVIKAIEVEIGKDLAGEVSDWDPWG